jgi:hypothetical protein
VTPPCHRTVTLSPEEATVSESPYITASYGTPSGLTDPERSLLLYLAIRTIAAQTGADLRTAAEALDRFAAQGRSVIRGDRLDVYLVVAGHVIVHAERIWLRAMAHRGAASLN